MEHDAISPGRDSSIELIRILAMAAIVLSHVTQTLQLPGGAGHIGTIAYCLDFESASPDPTFWVLVGLRSLGCWGNSLFIICSAWFLCRSANVRVNKICKMLMDVFAISIVGFTLALVFGVQPTFKDVAKCLLPNSLATNWFVTCYVLLYAIHPSINLVLGKLGKRGHAALAVVLFLLYMLAQVAYKGLFFSSQLLVMITEYVIVAYGRYYLAETLADAKNSWKVFAVGTLGTLLLIVLLEQVGVRVGSLSDKMLYFVKDGDPLLFLSAFGLFNLIRYRQGSFANLG